MGYPTKNLMWLHLSLGKINLEKTIEGQRLSPRQAGRLVWGGRRVYRGFHVIAYLSITLPSFVGFCRLLQIPDLRYLLVSALTPPTVGWISMGCVKYSTELFQWEGTGWLVFAWLPCLPPKAMLPFVLQDLPPLRNPLPSSSC